MKVTSKRTTKGRSENKKVSFNEVFLFRGIIPIRIIIVSYLALVVVRRKNPTLLIKAKAPKQKDVGVRWTIEESLSSRL